MVARWAPLILLLLTGAAHAQETFPVSQLRFNAIFASRPHGNAVYCLLGNGFFRTPQSGEEDSIIKAFLAAHTNAQVVPVTVTVPAPPPRTMIYAWVEDGEANLNVTLVREGAFPGPVMRDAIDAGLAAVVKDKPYRLIADDRYRAFIERVKAAEDAARREHKGVWSEAYQRSFKEQ